MVYRYASSIENVSIVAIISSDVCEGAASDMYGRGSGKCWRYMPWPCRWKSDVYPVIAKHFGEDNRIGYCRIWSLKLEALKVTLMLD